MLTQVCTRCEQEKPVDIWHFYKDRNGTFDVCCIACSKESKRKRAALNRAVQRQKFTRDRNPKLRLLEANDVPHA